MRGGGWWRVVRVVGVVVMLSVAWLQLALPPLPHDPPGISQESPEFDPAIGPVKNPTFKFLQVSSFI